VGRGGPRSFELERRSSGIGGFFKLQLLVSYNRTNKIAFVTNFGLPAFTSVLRVPLSPLAKQPN
jgi:hypothetical protein